VLRQLKRYEKALEMYDQFIRFDPNDARAFYTKGNVLANLKRYEEALAAFDQALPLDPNGAFALNNKEILIQLLDQEGKT
jgi:tetratricopeptide (TPR) repeat protein